MAVAIVEDGKIIYMKTLGVKDLTSGEKIDKNTLFGIGSNTNIYRNQRRTAGECGTDELGRSVI